MTQGTYQPSFMMSGTEKVWIGTYYAAPYRDPMLVAAEQAERSMRPTYAEQAADQIIADWQSSGEVKIETLRDLIIKVLEDYD